MIASALLFGFDDIAHAFFTRVGGVSKGFYSSLNVGLKTNDNRDHIITNRKIITQRLKIPENNLITATQVHGNQVALVDKPLSVDQLCNLEVDALITKEFNLAIGVTTADCLPILLFDCKEKIVAAIHCGWKGLFAGIIENTIAKCFELGSDCANLRIAFGSCIQVYSYEVSYEFYNNAIMINSEYESFFYKNKQEVMMFDLPACAKYKLLKLGVSVHNIDVISIDTLSNKDLFFSHRRTQKNNEPKRGVQLSCIALIN